MAPLILELKNIKKLLILLQGRFVTDSLDAEDTLKLLRMVRAVMVLGKVSDF